MTASLGEDGMTRPDNQRPWRFRASPPLRAAACGLALLLGAVLLAPAAAAVAPPARQAYAEPAPPQQYRAASPTDEIALARSAAPPSISGKAEILVMGPGGYETAVKGPNGFVCLVERSWGAAFEDPEFWNPKIRSPMCFNAAGAASVLPAYLERTRWALAGMSKAQMLARAKAQAARPGDRAPRPDAVCFMMSKQGYLADAFGHAHPHLMFFLAHTETAAWGANLPGSPVAADRASLDPFTTFYVSVPKWSDGTSAMAMP